MTWRPCSVTSAPIMVSFSPRPWAVQKYQRTKCLIRVATLHAARLVSLFLAKTRRKFRLAAMFRLGIAERSAQSGQQESGHNDQATLAVVRKTGFSACFPLVG